MTSPAKLHLLSLLVDNYGELVRYLTRRLGGAVDARDVVQDVFLKLHRTQHDQPIENPRSYLFRVADNLAFDHMRSQALRARHVSAGELPETMAPEPSPERVVDYRQRMARLERAVADLPPKQREAFLMHKFDGLSHAEVAAEMGITKSAVEKLIMKALAHCRARLDDPGETSG